MLASPQAGFLLVPKADTCECTANVRLRSETSAGDAWRLNDESVQNTFMPLEHQDLA
jgi:hypothetical protein